MYKYEWTYFQIFPCKHITTKIKSIDIQYRISAVAAYLNILCYEGKNSTEKCLNANYIWIIRAQNENFIQFFSLFDGTFE